MRVRYNGSEIIHLIEDGSIQWNDTLMSKATGNVMVIKSKAFKEYKKVTEGSGSSVRVIGNTIMREAKDTDDSSYYVEINEKQYEFESPKVSRTIGYLPVGNGDFVCVKKDCMGVVVLLLLAAIACILLCVALMHKPEQNGLDMENGSAYKQEQSGSTESQDYTNIPGFSDITASKDNALIQLGNPEENTVNFIYVISEVESENVVSTYESQQEASDYCLENNTKYDSTKTNDDGQLIDEDSTPITVLKKYSVIDNGDGTWGVNELQLKVIYVTKGVAPGTAVDRDLAVLGTGEHDVRIEIDTFDVDTNEACFGASQIVHVSIE